MKIAHVTAGAAGMYCGSCMNANTMAAALIDAGHQVALVPTYTPMRTDEEMVTGDRIFFGALNVFLQQKYPLFRHTPRLVDWLLDRPALLRRLARWSGKADSADIGALTLSMLEGESGHQAKELERLVRFLADFEPDVVHLSFAFFLGMARRLKETLGVPVVCSVQGEEIMLDEIPEPYRAQIVDEMRARAGDVEAVVAPNRAYGEAMAALLALPPEKVQVAYLGIRTDGYGERPRPAAGDDPGRPLTIGYLARICPEKGLDLLLQAFRRLTDERGSEGLRLRIAGYLGPRDRAWFETAMARVASWRLEHAVEHVGEVDRAGKAAFLASLDVFSVPTVYREPKGISVLEAMASGLPVVVPEHGTFPEQIAATGGGLLVTPEDPEALAAGLGRLLDDPALRHDLGRRAHAGVRETFSAEAAAGRLVDLYRALGAAG